MERKKAGLQWAAAGIGLLVLIFDGARALEGAQTGIQLCITTVIPSLFPFFVLSILFTSSLENYYSPKILVLSKFLGIPPAASSILVPAVLGGYPVGAKAVGDLYRNHRITKAEAEHLLAFCSNAGPSFLFGMVSGFFPEKRTIWTLWFIHIFSAFLTALSIPAENPKKEDSFSLGSKDNQAIIWSAAKAMCLVCCWVVLFRMVIAFLNAWLLWLLPVWLQVLLRGFLELTNGCCDLLLVSDIHLRFVLCSCMLSFGGVCVLLQTVGVTKGLSLAGYLKGKCLQTAFSFLLSCALVWQYGFFLLTAIPIFLILLRNTQNRCRNPRMIPV